VNRRRRQAKTDRLDAAALVTKLVEYVSGHRKVWSVVRVPPIEAEDLRHNDRELARLTEERTACRNAIRGLLKTQGIRLERLTDLRTQLERVRRFDGNELGPELRDRLVRVWERLELVEQQMQAVRTRRRELIDGESNAAKMARQLLELRSLGENASWELATEIFGWRRFSNRRQLGGLLGLVPVPYQSGNTARESGISKAGRGRLRATLIEVAWLWLRYQPNSALTWWFNTRYALGSKRLRRIGIVAVARKLLIELWKYLETGALPVGAETKA
jgi:transposase